jgi:hypothetical protein
MSKISSKNNHHIMDTLKKYKEKPLYEVPEHYFDRLQHDIMQLVSKEAKRRKTTKKWISAAGMAASMSLIFMLSYFIFINKNTDEAFYVHEEIVQPEDSILSLDSNHFAEATDITTIAHIDNARKQETAPLAANHTALPSNETIVYRAVDFYLDDYEISSFCEVMYDLECYYDY